MSSEPSSPPPFTPHPHNFIFIFLSGLGVRGACAFPSPCFPRKKDPQHFHRSGSSHRNYSSWCWGKHMRCRRWILGRPHVRQTLYVLCYHSSLLHALFIFLFPFVPPSSKGPPSSQSPSLRLEMTPQLPPTFASNLLHETKHSCVPHFLPCLQLGAQAPKSNNFIVPEDWLEPLLLNPST